VATVRVRAVMMAPARGRVKVQRIGGERTAGGGGKVTTRLPSTSLKADESVMLGWSTPGA
jgi:hypothetical protein